MGWIGHQKAGIGTFVRIHCRPIARCTITAAFDAQHLSIKIDGSKVTLGGKLNNWHERDIAETAAWSVPGVTQVQDKISLTW